MTASILKGDTVSKLQLIHVVLQLVISVLALIGRITEISLLIKGLSKS